MKHAYLLIFSCLLTTASHSQITITQDNYPDIGYSDQSVSETIPAALSYSSGADMNWDASDWEGETIFSDYVALSGADLQSQFPGSNLVEQIDYEGNTFETYYHKTSAQFDLHGQNLGPEQVWDYTENPRTLCTFPMTFGETSTDSWSGVLPQGYGYDITRSGTTTVDYAGYGSLQLPFGTLDNCALLILTSTYEDVVLGIPFINYTETLYQWLHAPTGSWVANYNEVTSSGISGYSTRYVGAGSVNIEAFGDDLEWTTDVYPNPSSGQVNIRTSDLELTQVEIYSIAGQLLKQFQMRGNTMLEEGQLVAGSYILRFIRDNEVLTETLMVR